MNKMVRAFLPVGQGAFYVEKFFLGKEKINIVFDCGSLTGLKYITDQIKVTFLPGEVIESVYISHLDKDHINGLEFLLNYCSVRKIYIPYLDEDEKIILKYSHLADGGYEDDFVSRFIDDPRKASEKDQDSNQEPPRIIEVPPYAEDRNRSDSDSEIDTRLSIDSESGKVIWRFIPRSFKSSKKAAFLQGLINEFGYSCTAKDIPNLWRSDAKRLKKVYRAVKCHPHTKSLVVYSGGETDSLRQVFCHFYKKCLCHHCPSCYGNFKSGCLYLGDLNCKIKSIYAEMHSKYSKWWDSIGVITIPHHGASSCYNSNLTDDLEKLYVISAGSNYRWHHPNPTVIMDMLGKGVVPAVVNEFQYSAVYLYVTI